MKKQQINHTRSSDREIKLRVKKPVIDHLVYVLPLKFLSENRQAFLEKVEGRIGKEIEANRCQRFFQKGPRYYLHNLRVPLLGGALATVQIGPMSPTNKGEIRVEFNPDRLTTKDIEFLHSWMPRILGKKTYARLLPRALINGMDVAVDIRGMLLDDYLVGCAHAQRKTVFGKQIGSSGRVCLRSSCEA